MKKAMQIITAVMFLTAFGAMGGIETGSISILKGMVIAGAAVALGSVLAMAVREMN